MIRHQTDWQVPELFDASGAHASDRVVVDLLVVEGEEEDTFHESLRLFVFAGLHLSELLQTQRTHLLEVRVSSLLVHFIQNLTQLILIISTERDGKPILVRRQTILGCPHHSWRCFKHEMLEGDDAILSELTTDVVQRKKLVRGIHDYSFSQYEATLHDDQASRYR